MIAFHEPAYYQITIRGELQNYVIEVFEGCNIKSNGDGEGIETKIKMKVKDQAHLFGILNMIYDSHLVILKIEIIDNV